METYFKIKLIMDFIIPISLILICILVISGYNLNIYFRNRLMRKLGYTYHRALGTNVAYEYQPYWEKGKIKIHYRKIDRLKYREIRDYVKRQEENESGRL